MCIHSRIDAPGSSAISHSRWLAAEGPGLGSDLGFHLGVECKTFKPCDGMPHLTHLVKRQI